jgi:hypothetical protein
LFAGKIQNIDFGDIVNPVGSDPNNPAFGGNGLSECIIELFSIIKDLSFPNHGGVRIQFVKMNGVSEFKNITINDDIISVEFINTVFDETSDYSKIIQGADYGGRGFTKYYLDNVLLQDRLDEKQDVLTEDNVGEFMDLELATKSTPTSGDTVLGRDSLTGKAVEIPTSSLGGNGNVDTSNLVPYTGATQDVNIGAHYFESAIGFKTPTGAYNQALTANGGIFDLNTKADLVSGKVPSSQLPSYVDDVLEFANLASFPATGESGKIYIAIDTNLTYRWGGSSYVVMSSSLALGETSSTAYRGDRGKIAYDHSQATGNPHGTTKSDIGLGNVENTSDLNKPISTATQAALNNKQDKLTNPITGTGTTNKISKFTANGVIGDSIIYENNNSISIGDDVSDARLRVKAQGALSTDIVFRVRNSTDTKDFLVVTGAGEVYNRGAQGNKYNTFFGENVGRNSTESSNSAFGYEALKVNTTGYSNSAFGTSALRTNTTGVQNSAFGNNALISNTTGNLNSAFGLNALYSNTEGDNNSAFGEGSLVRLQEIKTLLLVMVLEILSSVDIKTQHQITVFL